MGLLDEFMGAPGSERGNQIDGMAMGLLSARGGRGLSNALLGMQQARDSDLKSKLTKAQLEKYLAEADNEKQKTLQLAAAQQVAQRKQGALPGLWDVGAPAGPAEMGPPETMPAFNPMQPQPQARAGGGMPQFNVMRAIKEGFSADEINKYAALSNLGRQKVARTVEGVGPNGRPTTLQYDEYGQQVGQGVDKFLAPEVKDIGGSLVGLDPVTLQRLTEIKKTQTPDGMASNALGWANNATTQRGQNMTDARAREATALGGQTYDAERGLTINTRSGEARPVMQGGTPIGAKEKPLNDTQAKALQFSSRMENADQIINSLSKSGTNVSNPLANVPFGIGTLTSAMSPASNQKLEQAQRDFINAVLRRESGAAISPSEFENARKQYFPAMGDSPEVIAQKAQARALSTAGIKAEVPKGAPNLLQDLEANGKRSAVSGGGWSVTKVK
jgi:hypothetical protein